VLSGSIAGNTTVSGALTLTGGSIGAGATLETASGGTALLGGAIGNSGTLFASGAASLLEIVNGASVTGGGIAEVGNGILFIQAAGDTEMVDFLAAGSGGLELSDTAANTTAFGGTVSGLGGNTHQYIDLVSVTSNTSVHLSYTSASDTSGTLTVTSGGQTVASIALLGNYTSANFKLGADTGHHVEIIDPPVSVSSAVHSANIALFGGYIANFAAGGGFGGMAVIELPPPGSPPLLTQPHA
jgi:hypothetical protein